MGANIRFPPHNYTNLVVFRWMVFTTLYYGGVNLLLVHIYYHVSCVFHELLEYLQYTISVSVLYISPKGLSY